MRSGVRHFIKTCRAVVKYSCSRHNSQHCFDIVLPQKPSTQSWHTHTHNYVPSHFLNVIFCALALICTISKTATFIFFPMLKGCCKVDKLQRRAEKSWGFCLFLYPPPTSTAVSDRIKLTFTAVYQSLMLFFFIFKCGNKHNYSYCLHFFMWQTLNFWVSHKISVWK